MGHFSWTDAFHKQHYSRVIWSTLWYWIRKQINIWREKGGLRGHQKSIHQSNHTVNNAYRKLKGRLLMIKQEKTILLLNNYFSMFVWLHEIKWHLLYLMTQNARKRCCWHCNIWPITLLLISKLHTRVYEETFNVNIKIIIIQITQNIWNFTVGKSSLQEMVNFWRLSGRFHTIIWRPGDTVQNLESHGW